MFTRCRSTLMCYRSEVTLLLISLLAVACGGGDGNSPPATDINDEFIISTVNVNGSFMPPIATANTGEIVTFTVEPNTGFVLDAVEGCGGTLVGNSFTTGPITADCTVEATFIMQTQGANVVAIAAGDVMTAILTADGNVRVAGSNPDGQTCGAESELSFPTYTVIPGLTSVADMEACSVFIAVDEGGATSGCGNNGLGRLGLNDPTINNQFTPGTLAFMTSDSVRCHADHTLAKTPEGMVYAVGRGGLGVGAGILEEVHTPTLIEGLGQVIAYDAGGGFSVFANANGDLFATGDKSRGQLGDGFSSITINPDGSVSISDSVDPPEPLPVMVGNFGDVTDVKAGDSHVIVLLSDGSLLFWGDNNQGQGGLGTGLTESVNPELPVAIPGMSNIVAIDAEADWNMALDDQGIVYAWGSTPVVGPVNVPTEIEELPFVTQISAGSNLAMFVAQDGSVWGFGGDTIFNQFGTGFDNDPTAEPIVVFDGS